MGMFDSFYFEDGVLPDNKVPAGHEFQTKDFACNLDVYRVSANGKVRMFFMNYSDGRTEETKPLSGSGTIYSHEFLYDKPEGIFNRKYLGCKYQEYMIEFRDNQIVSAKKLAESGYAKPTEGGSNE